MVGAFAAEGRSRGEDDGGGAFEAEEYQEGLQTLELLAVWLRLLVGVQGVVVLESETGFVGEGNDVWGSWCVGFPCGILESFNAAHAQCISMEASKFNSCIKPQNLVHTIHDLSLPTREVRLRAIPFQQTKSSHTLHWIHRPHVLNPRPTYVLRFSFATAKVRARCPIEEGFPLTGHELGIRDRERTCGDVHDA